MCYGSGRGTSVGDGFWMPVAGRRECVRVFFIGEREVFLLLGCLCVVCVYCKAAVGGCL